MISMTVKKGYDLHVAGRPAPERRALDRPRQVALLPEHIPFVKPRLKVAVGDGVAIGSILIEDKRNTDLVFLSPGGGTVRDIRFGPRRVIREIVIDLDPEEKRVDFPKKTEGDIRAMAPEDLVRALMQGGVWPLIHELPFRGIADPSIRPASIWITLGGADRFQPLPEIYLKGREGLFSLGLKILKQFKVPVHVAAPEKARLGVLDSMVTHRVSGRYPALDPGVLLYHTKQNVDENLCWYLSGQDLLAIASLLKKGAYPIDRVVTVGGGRRDANRHLQTRLGVPVSDCIPDMKPDEACIAGGLLTGYEVRPDSYLGLYETSLLCIPRGNQAELFGFLRPGMGKPSFSRTFASVFQKDPFEMDNGMHGEPRACVNCGTCTRVCPVDILPQYTVKCLGADAIEEALEHGLLDCVECGLCSYVCPSKIEIREILRQARHDYYLEQG